MKQVLVEGAELISGSNIFEQGAGKLDLLGSYDILREYGLLWDILKVLI